MGYIGLEASAPPPQCDGCGTGLNDSTGLAYCEGCAPTLCDWCGNEHSASESSEEFGGHHCEACAAKFLDEDRDDAAEVPPETLTLVPESEGC